FSPRKRSQRSRFINFSKKRSSLSCCTGSRSLSSMFLLYLGRDYPKGADYFKRRLKSVFLKNKDVKDPEKIKELIEQGQFVMKELEALYFLKKYRAMKQRYYSDTNKTN
ncbi:hypothetical protein DBR06_SOUSAS3310023, partial [Sousa chinensis]